MSYSWAILGSDGAEVQGGDICSQVAYEDAIRPALIELGFDELLDALDGGYPIDDAARHQMIAAQLEALAETSAGKSRALPISNAAQQIRNAPAGTVVVLG